RLAVLEDDESLVALLVTDRHERLAARKPLAMAIPDAVGNAVLSNRTLPKRKGEELSPRLDGEAVSGRMHLETCEILGGVDEFARRLRAVRGHVDREARRRVLVRIEQPQVGAALIDDAPAVRLR